MDHDVVYVQQIGYHRASRDKATLILSDERTQKWLNHQSNGTGHDSIISIRHIQRPNTTSFKDISPILCGGARLFGREAKEAFS